MHFVFGIGTRVPSSRIRTKPSGILRFFSAIGIAVAMAMGDVDTRRHRIAERRMLKLLMLKRSIDERDEFKENSPVPAVAEGHAL